MAKPNTLFKDAYNRVLDLVAASDNLPSEARLGSDLDISRTTVRTILRSLSQAGVIAWDGNEKRILREPTQADYFPKSETASLSAVIERAVMRRIFSGDAHPGLAISEVDVARDVGIGVSAVREFLIRFSRFGLIEKRRHSQWVLKGFTRAFADELTDIRELFEIRSARLFAGLPDESPLWESLAALKAEHETLLDQVENRFEAFSELDERFHRLIHEASRNRFVTDFYDVIAMVFHYHYQWNKTGAKERNQAAIKEHLAYIRALQSRSTFEVDFYCRKHLQSARETLLASLRTEDDPPPPNLNDNALEPRP